MIDTRFQGVPNLNALATLNEANSSLLRIKMDLIFKGESYIFVEKFDPELFMVKIPSFDSAKRFS